MASRRYIGSRKRRRYRRFWAKALRDHSGSLLKYARRLTNNDVTKAEDLVQQVFVRILLYLPEPKSIRSTQHYLFRTLYTCWTRTKPRHEEVGLDEAAEPVVQFPTEKLELKVIMERVLEEMDIDNPDVRTVVEMKVAGCTFDEIGRKLGRDARYASYLWYCFFDELKARMTHPHKSTTEDKEKPAA